VNETEIIHEQEIITGLLETIIESNDLNLEVYEIEGDAIVYYGTENEFSPTQFYNASIKILKNFKDKIE
jgi:hypothetical protein